jgi:hypothetical protein
MNSRLLGLLVVVAVALLLVAEPALAGPGGKIARAVFESFWGRVLLVVLTLVFLPLIVMVLWKEKAAERRAFGDLRYLAQFAPPFEWLKLRERVTDCFHRVHAAWRREDVSEAAQWMTSWYWQNQQLAHLDRWESEGLRNVCNVKRIAGLKPLLVAHRNDGAEHEGSMVVVSITARMQDYLEERATGKVVEGSKTFKDVETLWTLTLVDGRWLVSNIEEGALSLTYAELMKKQPPVETTLGQKVAL